MHLSDNEAVLGGEVVCRDLEVKRCGTLSDTAGDIVVRTVARAEPSTKVTSLTDGDTSKMCADAYPD